MNQTIYQGYLQSETQTTKGKREMQKMLLVLEDKSGGKAADAKRAGLIEKTVSGVWSNRQQLLKGWQLE